MSTLVMIHVVTGLAGIAAGALIVVRMLLRRRISWWSEATFFLTMAAACGTGFVFLPTDGVTSAQLVSFFLIGLLGLAICARYLRGLEGGWRQIYAFAVVGSLFLNVLITTAQSFIHVGPLRALAPTQGSPVFVLVKVVLVLMFVTLALVTASRAGRP